MRTSLHLLVCVIALLVFGDMVSAQVITGIPPFGFFGGGPDVVNLANLNAETTIPIRHRAGRGIDFDYNLTYDSSVWQPVTVGSTKSWTPDSQWGWKRLQPAGESYITYSVVYSQSMCYNGGPVPYQEWDYSNIQYYDQFGNSHYFNTGNLQYFQSPGGANCPPNGPQPPTTQPAYESSGGGFTIYVTPGAGTMSAYVVDKNGTTINAPVNTAPPTTGSSLFTDRNGNEISATNGVNTDTLGTTALTVVNTPPTTTTLSYTAPSGAGAAYTVSYLSHTVRTNFACSGIVEYNSASIYLVDKVTLPDASYYQFSYEPTPGFPSDVTGRVASIRLPTGVVISYLYSCGGTGVNGITCNDGSAATLQRTTPDGVWSYAHSESGTAWTTNVTDPQNNITVLQFQGIFETQRQVYQGSIAPANLLQTVSTCYNGSACPTTFVPTGVTQRNVTVQLGNGGPQCSHVYFYDSNYDRLTERDDYAYATGTPTVILRKTLIAYASLGANIHDMPSSVTVKDGGGNIVAQTTSNYDETALGPTSGTPQHVAISGSRGNLTTLHYPVSGLATHFTYFDTGTVQTSTDVNGSVTTNSYTGSSCGNSFPTSVSRTQPISMSRSFAWNCTGGVLTQLTDENNQSISTTYSDTGFWRPDHQNYPDGGLNTWAYTPTSIKTTQKMNSTQNVINTVVLDGLGRTSQTQLSSDPIGTDYTVTTYDSLGRIGSVYNPTRCSPPTTNCGESTWGYTAYSYDALNRTTSVRTQDATSVTASYLNNIVTINDQASKARKVQTDALGRLTNVWEDPAGSNYQTVYTYDALDDLIGVVQNGSRNRSFAYDAMSRLLCEANPEISTATCPNPDNGAYTAGTIRYAYDSNGNLTSRTAPAPNQTGSATVTTSYTYDLLHRLTGKTYSDGTTASVTYAYDQSAPWGSQLSNYIGRLTTEYTSNGSGTLTDNLYNYDPLGRVIWRGQCQPLNCSLASQYAMYTYDLAGNPISLRTVQTGVLDFTISYGYNPASHLTTVSSNYVDAQHPATLFTTDATSGYFPNGALHKGAYGNGLTQTNVYNSRLQPCLIDVNNNGTLLQNCSDGTPAGNVLDFSMGYNAGTTNNGNLVTWNATGAQSSVRTYTYDSLNRLKTMADTAAAQACKGLSWTYDAWGNRTDQTLTSGTCNTFHAGVTAQNRITDPINNTYTYDAAGNMTHDASHSYTYDAEGRVTQVDGGSTASYLYNAEGQRVQKTVAGAWRDYIYDNSGKALAETIAAGWNVGYVYSGGQLLAQYSGSTTYFAHEDHLGSARLLTKLDKTIFDSSDFLPFGEQIAGASGTSHKFTSDERDFETNLDHTDFRQYSSALGRWITPDPAGIVVVDPTNPQSWNRYAYVLNNPLSMVDPEGLCDIGFDDAITCGGDDPNFVGAGANSFGPGPSTACTDAFDPCTPGALNAGAQPNLAGMFNEGPGGNDYGGVNTLVAAGCAAVNDSSDPGCWGAKLSFSGGLLQGNWSLDNYAAAQNPPPPKLGFAPVPPSDPLDLSRLFSASLKPSPLPNPTSRAYVCPAITTQIQQLQLQGGDPSVAKQLAALRTMYQKSCQ
jgi:RHS repeat-associated protein